MAKTWVLDTETKGTGAQMVPIEKTLTRPGRERDLALVELGGAPKASPAEHPPAPMRFRVVDVMSARTVVEDGGAREAVAALEGMRTVLDARVSVWSPERGRWRLLTLDETKRLWEFRGGTDGAPGVPPA
jgi:hypothetical protein